MSGAVGRNHTGLGVHRKAEAQGVEAGEIIADQALEQRVRGTPGVLLRPRTVHDARDIDVARAVAVTNGHSQPVTRGVLLDRVDAAANDLELAARDRALDLAVNAGCQAVAMRIPER